MSIGTPGSALSQPTTRLDAIARARHAVLVDGTGTHTGLVEPWIARSWQRCMARGQQPRQRVAFDALSQAAMNRAREGNRLLAQAARRTLRDLGRALADTRYFAILTNAHGVVIDTGGLIDRSDRRATLITRYGVDLSEPQVGTTAIGAVLHEQKPVWLHRGEHFFDDTSVYSCAGAPLFGPSGQCIGMLDLTGIDVAERPELLHLAVLSARAIENTLALAQPHAILLRLNWPGHPLGGDADALVGLDAHGVVTSCNRAARAMVPQLAQALTTGRPAPHADELFALSCDMLFDAARRSPSPIDIPLWSGLRLHALALAQGEAAGTTSATAMPSARTEPVAAPPLRRLRDVEAELIRDAVRQAGGNVAQAALRLGVSRATIYRKLGSPKAR